MQSSTYGRQAAAKSCDDGGRSRAAKSKPYKRMPKPPSLTNTFGQRASARMLAPHSARTASRLPA